MSSFTPPSSHVLAWSCRGPRLIVEQHGVDAHPIVRCGFLLCSALNLPVIVHIDFYIAEMSREGFGAINSVARPGNLFNFNESWPLQLSAASGWMYPIWAAATAYPLYIGLRGAGSWRCSLAPCALLVYGLCVVGGALHSGFGFSTILPQYLHSHRMSSTCAGHLHAAQAKVMDAYVFGYTPGPLAVIVASAWIAYVVAARKTRFPRWFVLFTPIVTMAWVAVGFLVLPDPWGMSLPARSALDTVRHEPGVCAIRGTSMKLWCPSVNCVTKSRR